MRIIDAWRGGGPAVWFCYRLIEEDGRFEVQVKSAEEPDEEFRPTVRGDGHAVARRVADLLRADDEKRNLLPMTARRS